MTSLSLWWKNYSELGVAALLGVAGFLVLWDASTITAPYSMGDPVGPKAVPRIVGVMLLVCAAGLVVQVLRGRSAPAEEGEDIEPGTPTDWKTVLPLIALLVITSSIVDAAGWVIAGFVLFWGAAATLGSRHWVRDPIIALVLSTTSFYGFYLGLGIRLPAGLLEGVL
ncbi:tripartite tricarboxylate transporter TctB family protein [Zhihengliuella sp.]|uniref:tripartite tricarboxylate transporter TctB family protein n=1 Tax=Zhihengliuella sp. TaxID=1954483 RepID=UPI0028110F75|nr:tripartite tricarboxylate transporter TctB family protein [Zhihengliuella sp.]